MNAVVSRQPLVTEFRVDRFVSKFCEEAISGCFLWNAGINEHGYGVFWNGERLEKAHRFALRAAGVAVPDTADVCHRCDNPACVNPSHLFVADAATNVADMWSKRRATVVVCSGEAQASSKLTDLSVFEIRMLWLSGRYKQRDIARRFSVSQRTVWRVVHHKNWRSVSGVDIQTGRGR